MKKNYIEGLLIVALYIIVSYLINLKSYPSFEILNYPFQLIIKPFQMEKVNIESINLAAFTIYFMWSISCVYLSFIKRLLKPVKLKKL